MRRQGAPMSAPPMRVCGRCARNLLLSDFERRPGDARAPWCADCRLTKTTTASTSASSYVVSARTPDEMLKKYEGLSEQLRRIRERRGGDVDPAATVQLRMVEQVAAELRNLFVARPPRACRCPVLLKRRLPKVMRGQERIPNVDWDVYGVAA